MQHIIGKLVRVFGSGQKKSRWFAGVLSTNIGQLRIAGTADTFVSVGSQLEFDGETQVDSYGTTWVPLKGTFIHRVLTTRAEVTQFLSSDIFKGIGDVTADKLYDAYGEDTMKELWSFHDNWEISKKVNIKLTRRPVGLSEKQFEVLMNGLSADKGFVRLIQSFPHMRPPVAQKVVEKLKKLSLDDLIATIRSKPYETLYQKCNVQFVDADSVAVLDLSVGVFDYQRVAWVLYIALRRFCGDRHATYVRISDVDEWYLFFKDYFMKVNLAVDFPQMWNGESLSSDCLARHIWDWSQQGRRGVFSVSDVRVGADGRNEVCLYGADMKSAEDSILSVFGKYCGKNVAADVVSTCNSRLALLQRWNKFTCSGCNIGGLSDEQYAAVKMVYQNPISFISGGPGRGKTSALKVLIQTWQNLISHEIMCLAPTGKAVNRLKAQTDYQNAGTVMRFLVMNQQTSLQSSFVSINRTNMSRKLDTLVIVDEVSMLSFVDAASLLNQVEGCTVVFVGDKDQLSPIEPGPFLQECLKSKAVPKTILTKNFRTKSRVINDNAEVVLRGEPVRKMNMFEPDAFMLVPCSEVVPDGDPYSVAEKYIRNMYLDYLHQGADFSDIMVISPFASEKYRLSSYNLNKMIQNEINPVFPQQSVKSGRDSLGLFIDRRGFDCHIKDMDGIALRVGDRVMNVKNNMDVIRHTFKNDNAWSNADKYPEDDSSAGIFNGDVGTIVKYYPSSAACAGGSVLIALDDTRSPDQKANDPRPIQFVHVPVDVDRFGNVRIVDWCLGYALTVHKAQGSEASCVILALSQKGFEATNYRVRFGGMPFLTRNMIYTAITRAKDTVYIVGSADALEQSIATPYVFSNVYLGHELDKLV